jgi:hypothetical protein
MKLQPAIERSLYAVVIVLSLIAVWLVLNAPTGLLNARVVYQGF